MLPELGTFCLILALGLSLLQIAAFAVKLTTVNLIRPLAMGQVFFVTLAVTMLLICFVANDFSVLYVANNSNSSLPLYYKITALWGAHEGSLLLWIFILSCWVMAVIFATRHWSLSLVNNILAVLAAINIGFMSLLLWSSNPFARNFINLPLDGADLNPLLQDFGMIIHPPILYIGYVGCGVAFAFSIAALLQGKLDETWARKLRPWVLVSWSCLTIGIALGSWWAYYELGWGGWWFWDPVENASFMPWLSATALMHCLAIASKNGQLLRLAVFIAIATFALSLLGTFLVRSGSVTSVHAFAADPQRGLFILQFLTISIGGAVVLYALRAPKLALPKTSKVSVTQPAGLIVINNIILSIATTVVLIGTIYPLIHDAIFGQQISIGYPFFNAVFVPIMLLLCLVLICGTIANIKLLFYTLIITVLGAVLFLTLWFGTVKINAAIGLIFAMAIVISCFKSKSISMLLGHLGLAVSIIGISLTPGYEIEKEVSMHVGDTLQIARYTVKFAEINNIDGPNYLGFKAKFIITNLNNRSDVIFPQKLIYVAREQAMSETAILPGLFEDIYIALGQQLDDSAWSARICYKPFVRWIWLGAVIMACGGLYGVWPKKFKRKMLTRC
jgi:cytochrome c-type biogenesis protein CcmF